MLHDGSIYLGKWIHNGLLEDLSVLKASQREIQMITGVMEPVRGLRKLNGLGVDVAVATRSRFGALVSSVKRGFTVPAYECVTLDPTGAGDAFLAGFFHEYTRGSSLEWCGSVGSASASIVVETIGPRVIRPRKELMDRAEKILEGVR